MKFTAKSVFLILCSSLTSQAFACGSVLETRKIKNSDLVVEGIAYCSEGSSQCTIRPTRVIKQSRLLRFPIGKLQVLIDYDQYERNRKAGIIACPTSWVPNDDKEEGVFYLSRSADSKYRAFYQADIKYEDEPK